MDSDKMYDVRVVQRNIQKKLLKISDYEAYLKKLKDLKNECEPIELKDKEKKS